MNLIFRMLRLLLRRNKLPIISPLETVYTQIRVWPLDCDFNLHLTNSRYPSLLDLARTKYLMQLNSLPLLFSGKWKSVLSSQTISFIKEIKPFEAVEITTRVLSWDRKYCYIEHRFLVNNKVHAKALARVAFIKGKRVRSFDKFLAEVDENNVIESPNQPEQVTAWQQLLVANK